MVPESVTDAPTPGSGGAPPSTDWGVGRYESTAAQLLPASEVVVRIAAVKPDERVVDLGCGTGNAALLAACVYLVTIAFEGEEPVDIAGVALPALADTRRRLLTVGAMSSHRLAWPGPRAQHRAWREPTTA